MRTLLAVFALSLVVGVAVAADTADAAIRKGFNGFSGTVRGTVRVDQNAAGGPAVWVEQVGGPTVRILTDDVGEWQSLANGPAAIKGDVALFGGKPVMIVKKATPRKEKVGAASANFDVQGRVLITSDGDVAIKTRDGFVRVTNAEIVGKMKELGVGAKVKVKGVLDVGNGGFVLNATSIRDDKSGDSHRRGGRGELKLGRKPVKGKASSVGITLDKHEDVKKTTVALKKPRKKGKRAADIWDTHKSVVTIGQPGQQ